MSKSLSYIPPSDISPKCSVLHQSVANNLVEQKAKCDEDKPEPKENLNTQIQAVHDESKKHALELLGIEQRQKIESVLSQQRELSIAASELTQGAKDEIGKSKSQVMLPLENQFELHRGNDQQYFLTNAKTGELCPIADGIYDFAIFSAEPTAIRCIPRSSEPKLVGHTSITHFDGVVFAGEITIKNNQLLNWSNFSGHYRATTESAKIQSPSIYLLLPFNRYEAVDELLEDMNMLNRDMQDIDELQDEYLITNDYCEYVGYGIDFDSEGELIWPDDEDLNDEHSG